MNTPIDRRGFLKSTALAAAAVTAWQSRDSLAADAPASEKRFRKAVKLSMVQGNDSILDKFKMLKEAGFDGVEIDSPSGLNHDEVVEARKQTGLIVHGVINSVHWKKPFSHAEASVRKEAVEALNTALRDAKHYGATTVLVVPGVVSKECAYNDAYKRSQEEIRKCLPVAKEMNIKIAFENVWNNFLLSPLEAARYVDEFESPMVGWYFDVGNVVRSGWPEHWIHILGKRILKMDIKEYSREKRDKEGLWKGFQVELLEGDCDWPAVMKASRDIGYIGWGTAEVPGGGRDRMKFLAERMDRIFAS